MKQYTTRFLKFVAFFYMAFPGTYLLTAALLFDIPGSRCVQILLSPWYYILSALAIIAGYGFWEMRRWAWYVFLVTNILVGYSNAVMASHYGESNHRVVAFILSILALIALLYRVAREVRVPYFLPRIRWWESDPRYKLSVPVAIIDTEKKSHSGEILDLSLGGCFIKLRDKVSLDSSLTLSFMIFGLNIDIAGTVVWRTQSAVTHPMGIGIKFNPLTRPQKHELKAITQRLRTISNLYRTSRYLMNQDEFDRRMEELQTGVIQLPPERGIKRSI